MERRPQDLPSGIYRYQHTPKGRVPLAGRNTARTELVALSRVTRQLQWSLPLAALLAIALLSLPLLPTPVQIPHVIYIVAAMGFVPAIAHLSRWSRLRSHLY